MEFAMYQEITDAQWIGLSELFPAPLKRGRGKPHASWRSVANSILWVLSTGSNWEALPKLPSYASKSAAHRWYKVWKNTGLLDRLLAKLPELSMLIVPKFPSTRNRMRKGDLQLTLNIG
jgi:transposase